MVPSQELVAVWRDGWNLTDEQRAAALEKLAISVATTTDWPDIPPPPPPPSPPPPPHPRRSSA